MIYLKGTSSSKYDLAGGVSSTFKVLLRVCGNEQIAVLSDEPFVLSESVTATVQTIPMTDFFSVSTEIDCSETEYILTSDQAGTVLLSNSATATISSGILSIDKSSPASMSFFIFAKTKGWKTAVKEISVLICGDETISNIDPSNELFTIAEIGNPDAEEWRQFSLAGIYETASAILPRNACPVTSYKVCVDSMCMTEFDSTSVRISADSSSFEVNANIPIATSTIYLESLTVSGRSLIEPVSIFVCGFEVFSLVNSQPFTDTIEVFSGEHQFDTSAFFLNSHEDQCPTQSYALKMDAAGNIDLNTTLASIFTIN